MSEEKEAKKALHHAGPSSCREFISTWDWDSPAAWTRLASQADSYPNARRLDHRKLVWTDGLPLDELRQATSNVYSRKASRQSRPTTRGDGGAQRSLPPVPPANLSPAPYRRLHRWRPSQLQAANRGDAVNRVMSELRNVLQAGITRLGPLDETIQPSDRQWRAC